MKLASSQPPVSVAKGNISFATMTHGCKAKQNIVTVKNLDESINLAKKGQFHFSFFKVDYQKPKFNLGFFFGFLVDSVYML